MGDKGKGDIKAPNFSKDYERGIKIGLKYLPKQLRTEYENRAEWDPKFIEQAMGLQEAYDPRLAKEQFDALQRRDPQFVAAHQAFGDKVIEALNRGYIDPTRAKLYEATGKLATGDVLRGETMSPTEIRQRTQALMAKQPALSYGEAQDMVQSSGLGMYGHQLQMQRQQAANQLLNQQSESDLALTAGGRYMGTPGLVQMENQIPGVQAPNQFRYVNPNAGYQGAQYGLQNFQNMMAANQAGGGGSNPWTNALQGAAQGASYGSYGGGYGAAGGAITGAAAGAFGYPQYSTILLKTDVKKVGEHNGLDIVEFRYKGRQVHYRGVIAEQVKEKFPEAVGVRNGYLTVDYDKLGIPMERECKYCKRFKPLSDFPKASNGAQGRRSRCLECYRGYDRKLIDPRREEHLEYHRNWNRQNKDRHQVLNIVAKFKCTHAEAMRLQAIRKIATECALCGGSPTKRGLFIDHCHKTGKIRGMLCHKCNAGLGQFEEDPIKLQKAIIYLLKYLDEEEEDEVTPAKNNGSRTRPVGKEVVNAN